MALLNKKYSYYLLLIFILIFAIKPAYTQNNLAFYLDSAYVNNPSIKEALNNIRLSEFNKNMIDAQYDATHVSVTANYLFTPYLNNNGTYVTSNPGANAIGYDASIKNGGLYSALINVEKNIFNSNYLNTYKTQFDIQINRTRNTIELLHHALQKDITDQYLKCYQAQELYKSTLEIVDKLNQQLNLTESLVNSGQAKQSDFYLLKIEVDNQNINAEQFLSDFRNNLYSLNSLCGLKDTSTVSMGDIELKYDSSVSRSKFFRQFAIDSTMMLNQQDIFETKYLPQVIVFLNSGLNAVELPGIQRKFGMSVGLNFQYPLYDGNQQSIVRQQTQISLNTIRGYKENQSVILMNKLKDAQAQIEFNFRNLQKINNQIVNYDRVIAISQGELQHGQMSMIDFITIMKNYIELKKSKLTAATAYLQAINQYNYWNW